MTEHTSSLDERLRNHPQLRERFEEILAIIEDTGGNIDLADEAERQVIQEVRKLGHTVLQGWAIQKESQKSKELRNAQCSASSNGKKKLHWNTTYGEIAIEERVFVRHGKLIRPFSMAASVNNRGYSMPLQRCLTDFGADDSFADAAKKVLEHYGVTVPTGAVQRITEEHAGQMRHQECLLKEFPDGPGAEYIIVEADGCMVPLVEIAPHADEQPTDGRRRRQLVWQEARLVLAHQLGSVTPVYGATFGSTDDTGDHMLHCAIMAGGCSLSSIHCVGDGAPWIAIQADRVYGDQVRYLIDFYHMSDYLSAAAPRCFPQSPDIWREEMQLLLKTGHISDVLKTLERNLEPEDVLDKDAHVRKCHRYMTNRLGQFEYASAIAAGLPIGSGEIESGNRHVVQKRLKIAGAWWKKNNADNMLALRTVRANGNWDKYWEKNAKKAA